MVEAHPRTGAAVLNVNEMHTDRVVGLTESESDALLAELYDVLYGVGNTFRLDWHVGDLAVWDNLALQHHRPDFPTTEGRTMQRVCINPKTDGATGTEPRRAPGVNRAFGDQRG